MPELKRVFTDANNPEDIAAFLCSLETQGDILNASYPYVDVRTLTHAGTFIDEQTDEPILIVCRQASFRSPTGDLGDSVTHYALSLSFLDKVANQEQAPQKRRLEQLAGDARRSVEKGVCRKGSIHEMQMPQDRHSFNGQKITSGM